MARASATYVELHSSLGRAWHVGRQSRMCHEHSHGRPNWGQNSFMLACVSVEKAMVASVKASRANQSNEGMIIFVEKGALGHGGLPRRLPGDATRPKAGDLRADSQWTG